MNSELPRGVILISLDAVRADHLSHFGYHRETSPFLDSVDADNLGFRNAYSASSHTREAVPAILTGRDPIAFAQAGFTLCQESLAERLHNRGFDTGAFHSNPYLSRAYGFDTGFSAFFDDLLLGKNKFLALAQTALNKFVLKTGDYQARAPEINSRSLRWLASVDRDSPFFLWNHYMDAHGPYNPPEGFSPFSDEAVTDSRAQQLYRKAVKRPDSITDTEQQLLIDLYDGEITYLDAQLREFFEELERMGILSESLVVITSDHGDGFGRHGYYGHPRKLFNELLHVPLLVMGPDTNPGTIERPVSTLTIVPTVLDRLGLPHEDLMGHPLPPPSDVSDGSGSNLIYSSVQGENSRTHVRAFSAQSRRWKAVIERDVRTNEVLDEYGFDLGADPGESARVKNVSDDELAAIFETLDRYSANRIDGREQWTAESEEVSDEIQERLEILGYK